MKKILIGTFSILISSGIFFSQAKPDGLLHVYFLDVGQGDSILIRGPSGENILVDGGAQQTVVSELNAVLPFFNKTIDYVLLTHPDRDHIEGLISVLKRYQVKHVVFTGAGKQSYFYDSFIKAIHDKNIPVTIADEKSDIVFADGLFVDVIFPFTQIIGANTDTNNTSLITKVIYGKNRVLLTGDSEAPEEEKLLQADADLHAEVLKIGHHGSHTSTTQNFLNAVSPSYSVISVGKGNTYHHPHPSIVKRLKEFGTAVLRTDEDGRVEFIFSKEKIIEIKNQSKRVISAPSARSFSSNPS